MYDLSPGKINSVIYSNSCMNSKITVTGVKK